MKSAKFNVCDAISVELINNLTKSRKIKSFPGPDLFKIISDQSEIRQFFIGGESKDLLQSLQRNINNNNLSEDNFYCPPFLSVEKFDYLKIAKKINNLNPDIIWIGLGAPKQEVFMSNLLPHIKRGLLIGVGAAFNFYSGYKKNKRAPYLLRKMKGEWIYRLIKEPKKTIPRVIRNLYYLPIILFREI